MFECIKNWGSPPSVIGDLRWFWLYYLGSLVYLVSNSFKLFWLSNLLILSVPDEGYYILIISIFFARQGLSGPYQMSSKSESDVDLIILVERKQILIIFLSVISQF